MAHPWHAREAVKSYIPMIPTWPSCIGCTAQSICTKLSRMWIRPFSKALKRFFRELEYSSTAKLYSCLHPAYASVCMYKKKSGARYRAQRKHTSDVLYADKFQDPQTKTTKQIRSSNIDMAPLYLRLNNSDI